MTAHALPRGTTRLGIVSGPIIAEVSARRGIGIPGLVGPGRQAEVVAARHEIAYRLACETALSLQQIAKAIGRSDHTTALHAIRSFAAAASLPLPRGMQPGQAKPRTRDTLAADKVGEARRLRGMNWTIADIASHLRVSPALVSRVCADLPHHQRLHTPDRLRLSRLALAAGRFTKPELHAAGVPRGALRSIVTRLARDGLLEPGGLVDNARLWIVTAAGAAALPSIRELEDRLGTE